MSRKVLLNRRVVSYLLASSVVFSSMSAVWAANNTISNTQLPVLGNGSYTNGVNITTSEKNNSMTINQGDLQNAVIQWGGGFNVGANATVNFQGNKNGYNVLNYDKSGNMSQIYGTITANNNGNVYIVNPSGVQIGNSAQINVGSLHVSNKKLSEASIDKDGNINAVIDSSFTASAEIMSLGNINANNVTFDGSRVVLDVDRVKNVDGSKAIGADNIIIKTDDRNKVVLGYTAYDVADDNGENKNSYINKNTDEELAKLYVNGTEDTNGYTKADGYMWVKDGEQLQKINTNVSGNYALRNSIDLNVVDFTSIIGKDAEGNDVAFSGKLDGIGNDIFGLNGNNGLFKEVDGAEIRNFNLISGSIGAASSNNIGAVAGVANNTIIENIMNTVDVEGNTNVGGIIGSGTDVTLNNVVNSGSVKGHTNVGGLAGSIKGSEVIGESYNLGNVQGNNNTSYNIGGLVGSGSNITIGNDAEGAFTIYNHVDITGGYNVGGIIGNMENSTVINVSNDADIKATGYTSDVYKYHSGNGLKTVSVNAANVGGIAGSSSGSTFRDVDNSGDVASNKQNDNDFYDAGNVGGIVGRAQNTNITNATNKENDIRGAHNVGGIAGYFGYVEENVGTTIVDKSGDTVANEEPKYTIERGINDGSDIMATGARWNGDFVKEQVRPGDRGNEENIFGNMGGIAGYMYGDNVYITKSANRGTVHSLDITDQSNVVDASKASNIGGIVGKIDRGNTKKLNNNQIVDEDGTLATAAVSDSYNVGDVRGYMGVGGVAGMMYNGEIVASYNLGSINTTRQAGAVEGSFYSVNMGGIVGDTTEQSGASALLYDVYNKGQIGDDTYTYYARHVGGIVGRLSGTVEKAYNNGNIYNGYSVVGGIAGWMASGTINNSFNTGNITVVNNESEKYAFGSQVGGIVGSAALGTKISNAYNLGILRSFVEKGINNYNSLAGIVGNIDSTSGNGKVTIENVYTTGNLYINNSNSNTNDKIGTIYAKVHQLDTDNNPAGNYLGISNAYYITPETGSGFEEIDADITTGDLYYKKIDFGSRHNSGSYDGFGFVTTGDNKDELNSDANGVWRIYEGSTTPILNAFMPNSAGHLGDGSKIDGITGIQYGTAYDPLLTIINVDKDITLNWDNLGTNNHGSIAVYGGGLKVEDFSNDKDTSGYYSGTIYTDGNLQIEGKVDGDGDISLGKNSHLYGSSVSINTDGNITINGNITATNNKDYQNDINNGYINITGGEVNIFGKLVSAANGTTTNIGGIGSSGGTITGTINVKDKYTAMPDIGDLYGHKVVAGKSKGDITITATKGDANLYFGHEQSGIISTSGDVTVSAANGSVYIDSDLDISGNLTAEASAAGEIILDVTNVGKASLKDYADNLNGAFADAEIKIDGNSIGNKNDDGSYTISDDQIIAAIESIIGTIDHDDPELAVFIAHLRAYDNENNTDGSFSEYVTNAIVQSRMHEFLHSFGNKDEKGNPVGPFISFNGTENAKITVDMWDYNKNQFNLDKYDMGSHTLSDELTALNVKMDGTPLKSGQELVHIWISDAEQLNGIQKYADDNPDSSILSYNFALKDDIDATDIGTTEDNKYNIIGGNGTAFTGKFDGRNHTITGLEVTGTSTDVNVGIFGVNAGTIKNLKVISSNFTGSGNVGAIAGTNKGTIDNITTIGNDIRSTTKTDDPSQTLQSYTPSIGGIVGVNDVVTKDDEGNITGGSISNVTANDSVIAEIDGTILGGIVGTNDGVLDTVESHTAVAVTNPKEASKATALGGVVGINTGSINNAKAFGVTGNGKSDHLGGIIGINKGTVESAYNESIVTGNSNVGGVIGTNGYDNVKGTVSDASNASDVKGNSIYVGGLVGNNGDGSSVESGRNAGTITGKDYVGGLVGNNGVGSVLKDLFNTSSAHIVGNQYVGGVAGSNAGTITNASNVVNYGTISGNMYVGGIAGVNKAKGSIENTISNLDLIAVTVDSNSDGKIDDPEYFGGVVGQNYGEITNASNSGNITAENATYVGGIVGHNTFTGKLTHTSGVLQNSGNVEGGSYVGGIIGQNDADISGISIINTGRVTANAGGAGGIIGVNNGKISGGRGEGYYGLNYYKYYVVNNGIVIGTESVGGLIGTNGKNGSLTLGYNTGNVTGNKNVGGVIGNNEGYADQIFAAGNDKTGIVTGENNVGGLIGNNSGSLSNAYADNSINKVIGNVANSAIGNAVGVNSGNIDAVYSTATSGILIADNTKGTTSHVYTWSKSDDSATYLDVKKRYTESSYEGFDGSIWKFYNGKTGPLLKNFLSQAKWVNGHWVTADNNAAYDNTYKENDSNNLINSEHITDWDIYWSYQIDLNGTNGNPNNLGYDLVNIENSEISLIDREKHLRHIDDPFDRNKDFRERKVEINFFEGV